MNLIQSKKASVNYLAKVVNIQVFKKHSDPEVTKLKCCSIDGFNIITGINAEPGLYIYFPAGCCINPQLISYTNSFRHSELNRDTTKSGMFEDTGRVKAIKLRGELSEGFIMPATDFQNWVIDSVNKDVDLKEGLEFDTVEHEGKTFWVNKKYIVKRTQGTPGRSSKEAHKIKKAWDKVIPSQFRFHYDTLLLKKNPNVIQPDDLISITYKIHGTSHISANVLVRKKPNWKEKLANWITGNKENYKYDNLYASRSVIKNRYYNKNQNGGFYNCDVWAYADKYLRPYLIKGMTIYAEIVGYLPNGSMIQKNYDYGCAKPNVIPDTLEYLPEKHFKVRPYRITLTNVDGEVHEFSAREVQQYCKSVGLTPVEECYYGFAKDLYPDLKIDQHWSENFMEKLANDKNFYMELVSPHCKNKVPHEGLVIKKEDSLSHAWKLKCFKFINKEQELLDKGESNIEDEA